MNANRFNYLKNRCYPKVKAAVHANLQKRGFVAPVDVFVQLGHLRPQHLESWRRGQVPFLERVISRNLAKAERIVRILKVHAEDRGLKPSWTAYRKWGKGRKVVLRFSKTGNPYIENLYSTHYVAFGSRRGPQRPVGMKPDGATQGESPDG